MSGDPNPPDGPERPRRRRPRRPSDEAPPEATPTDTSRGTRPEPGAPDATAARANAITRRTLAGVLAALFLFGSCGIAYGVFRVASGGGGEVSTLPPPGPGSPSPTTTTQAPVPGVDLVVSELTGVGVAVRNIGTEGAGRFVVSAAGRAFIVEDGLGPGEQASFVFACREGPLTAVADATERIEEADETNNSRTAGPFDCEGPTPGVTVPGGTTTTTPTTRTTTSPGQTTTTTQPPTELPDLVIGSVASDRVTVSNVGQAAAGSFTVNITGVGNVNVSGLAAGASRNILFSCQEGSITATADSTGRVEESNEGNNVRSAGPFECLPDLIVVAITADRVTIANVGDGSAGPSQVSINGSLFAVPALGRGQQAVVNYGCIGGTIHVVADATQAVAESNESNNQANADVGPC